MLHFKAFEVIPIIHYIFPFYRSNQLDAHDKEFIKHFYTISVFTAFLYSTCLPKPKHCCTFRV